MRYPGYVYGLFSGGTVLEEGTPWATNEVQVYTWDGKLAKTLYLDRTVHAVTVDDSDAWAVRERSGTPPVGRAFPATGARA